MKRKKMFLLVLSVLMMCGCTKSEGKKEVVVSQQEEAWQLFMSSIDKLQSHNQITIYDVIGTQDGAHGDSDYDEVDGKPKMTYLQYYYNCFITKTVIDNVKKETTYINDYGVVGQSKSKGNKLCTKIKDEDNEKASYDGWVEIEKEPTIESAKEIIMPYYNKMKKGQIKETSKYIISDGKATAYIEGKKRYDSLDIKENSDLGVNVGKFPVLNIEYVNGLLGVMKEESWFADKQRFAADFSGSWLYVLKDATRTTWGTNLPSREFCSVKIDKNNENTVINYMLDKESSAYMEYIQMISEVSKDESKRYDEAQYFDDVNINIIIDKDGNLKSMEFANRIAFLNEGIKDFRVPQYIYIEFEYK